ncbi:MAG: hypothetical protein FWD77_09060 [Betaproteobacteria bacterium]|nr:hypothetical protein [Betaproteobacteria bacterium]
MMNDLESGLRGPDRNFSEAAMIAFCVPMEFLDPEFDCGKLPDEVCPTRVVTGGGLPLQQLGAIEQQQQGNDYHQHLEMPTTFARSWRHTTVTPFPGKIARKSPCWAIFRPPEGSITKNRRSGGFLFFEGISAG